MNLNIVEIPPIETFKIDVSSSLFREFSIYYEEAQFALKLFHEKFDKLNTNHRILEIGSGIGLLAIHLNSCGFQDITCIEPDSIGFGTMLEISNIIKKHPRYENNNIKWLNMGIEDYVSESNFDFVFSFNVMEHIADLVNVFDKLDGLLSSNGCYHFVCPNYAFPYEGHFNIPIILNKKITYFLFKKRIESYKTNDALGLWKSLNWISTNRIRKLNRNIYQLTFSGQASNLYFDRFNQDTKFKERKGLIVKTLAVFSKPFISKLPFSLKPVIECTVTRNSKR